VRVSDSASPRDALDRLLRGITHRQWADLPDLYAQDAVVEQPFAMPHAVRLVGRDEIRAHFSAAVRVPFEFQVGGLTVHETTNPEVVVAEFDYHGRVTTTGRRLVVPNIQVLCVRGGQIVTSRDYHHHQALAQALASDG
jgi:ketosteroid isomerase-like protein